MKNNVIFTSSNINFIKLNQDLVNGYLTMVNDPLVSRFISHNPRTFTYDEEVLWVESKLKDNSIIFSMLDKETNKFIGNIELMSLCDDGGELGICITTSMQDKHYGTEALKAFIDYCFETYDLNRIFLRVYLDNTRAIHVYEKAGFKEYDRKDDDIYMEIRF